MIFLIKNYSSEFSQCSAMIEIKKTALPQIRTFNKINDIPTTSPFLVSGLLNASMETISAESEGEK